MNSVRKSRLNPNWKAALLPPSDVTGRPELEITDMVSLDKVVMALPALHPYQEEVYQRVMAMKTLPVLAVDPAPGYAHLSALRSPDMVERPPVLLVDSLTEFSALAEQRTRTLSIDQLREEQDVRKIMERLDGIAPRRSARFDRVPSYSNGHLKREAAKPKEPPKAKPSSLLGSLMKRI